MLYCQKIQNLLIEPFIDFKRISLLLKKNKMDQPNSQQPNQLNIEISEEVSEGSYANLVIITHSHAEFVVDFVNVMPGTPKSKVKSRIILTPTHAKRFMKAMIENVKKFESVNGTIQDIEAVELPLNFGGPTAQA
jgi:ribonuclease BN (tRNA processing enzyme)